MFMRNLSLSQGMNELPVKIWSEYDILIHKNVGVEGWIDCHCRTIACFNYSSVTDIVAISLKYRAGKLCCCLVTGL